MLPNLLFIGPNKAGSTWLYELLDWHPQAFVPSAKEVYFFDFYFDRGVPWYERQYRNATPDQVLRADISHDYLFNVDAPVRVKGVLDEPTMMLTLREPVERSFSEYLYMRKQGRVSGSFEDAIESNPDIVSHSRYALHLERWLDVFPKDRFLFTVFDDLRDDSSAFALDLFGRLGLDPLQPPADVLAPSLERTASRSTAVARLASQGSVLARRVGLAPIVARVKSNRAVSAVLYRDYDDPPQLAQSTREALRTEFRPDVARMEDLAGVPLLKRWGYS